MVYSDAFVKHVSAGSFPGRIDPWAEIGHYFHQIHGLMIDHLITQLHPELVKMGYIIGKEASLQIAEAGEIFEMDVDMEAIHIKEHENGRLVTVVEIISPNNKTKSEGMNDYRARRERLVLERNVNVVEIDLTRSIKRLVNDSSAAAYAYHVAIYIPGESPRLVGIKYGHSLKRIALPLRAEVAPIELQRAYDYAYQLVTIAAQIEQDNRYLEDELPFPSLLTELQRHEGLEAVQKWRDRLEQLKSEQA